MDAWYEETEPQKTHTLMRHEMLMKQSARSSDGSV